MRAQRDLVLERVDDRVGEVDLVEGLAASEPARAEDVHLHQLVADDVEADEEHAVGDELRADRLASSQHRRR